MIKTHNGVAFHPPAPNSNAGLKNFCQKLVKTLFNWTNLKYNMSLQNQS